MRPRKNVLYVCADQETVSRCVFVLGTRTGLRAYGAQRFSVALGIVLNRGPVDAMVIHGEHEEMDVLLELRMLDPEMRILMIGMVDRTGVVDAMLPKQATMATIVEALQILTARKRGPKPTRVSPSVALRAG